MDSTTNRRFTRTEVRLDEPHFDEATLLSAQPVVPLEEVKASTRSKARLALALAIGGGLLIGLLAATFIYRFVGGNQSQVSETAAATEQPNAADQDNSAGGLTAGADETTAINPDETKSPTAPIRETQPEPVKVEPPPAKPEPRQNAPKSRPVIIVRDESDGEDYGESDKEARRAERQEERRQRRRAARQARREEAQSTDDLLRIREIFEGSPRP